MEDWVARLAKEHSDNIKAVKEVLRRARDAGLVGEIRLCYDGCGDSGDMNFEEFPEGFEKWASENGIDLQGWGGGRRWDDKKNAWVEVDQSKLYFLSMCSRIPPGGWEINEGSWGEVILNIDTGEIRDEHNARFESSEFSEHTF